MVGAIVLSPTDAANQEAVMGSAQRVVVTRAQARRDAAVQHYLDISTLNTRILSSRGAFVYDTWFYLVLIYNIYGRSLERIPLVVLAVEEKREAYIEWSMVTCQGNIRSELP